MKSASSSSAVERQATAWMPPSSAVSAIVATVMDWEATAMTDAGGDRGVFSDVFRVRLAPCGHAPATVVVKLPARGPNGSAAREMGAYEREALAYETILDPAGRGHPRCYQVQRDDDRGAAFVLEDLATAEAVDQLEGLSAAQAVQVADALGTLHQAALPRPLEDLPVRRSTPQTLDPAALQTGLDRVQTEWGATTMRPFAALLARRAALVDRFTAEPEITLCHGDPRADNLVFRDNEVVLFDWQQLAVQFGEADLAWLAATSLTPENRRQVDQKLISAYATRLNASPESVAQRYRLGFVLPGLTVLMLAQRSATTPRMREMISTTVARVADALETLDVAGL